MTTLGSPLRERQWKWWTSSRARGDVAAAPSAGAACAALGGLLLVSGLPPPHEAFVSDARRYEEDIANAARLGSNSFRLSIEWSRLMPRPGVVDQAAKQRWGTRRLLARAAAERGIAGGPWPCGQQEAWFWWWWWCCRCRCRC